MVKLNFTMLKSIIESLLFISDRPLSQNELAKLLNTEQQKVGESLKELAVKYNQDEDSGIQLVEHEGRWQVVTAPANTKIVQEFLKNEVTGELTQPSLETLAIISYRGPIAKEELDEIRGVNCALILRNLMIKGLVESREEKDRTFYDISFDFLKHLGIKNRKELPDYDKLNQIPLEGK